jgi:hypothetical protein
MCILTALESKEWVGNVRIQFDQAEKIQKARLDDSDSRSPQVFELKPSGFGDTA